MLIWSHVLYHYLVVKAILKISKVFQRTSIPCTLSSITDSPPYLILGIRLFSKYSSFHFTADQSEVFVLQISQSYFIWSKHVVPIKVLVKNGECHTFTCVTVIENYSSGVTSGWHLYLSNDHYGDSHKKQITVCAADFQHCVLEIFHFSNQ